MSVCSNSDGCNRTGDEVETFLLLWVVLHLTGEKIEFGRRSVSLRYRETERRKDREREYISVTDNYQLNTRS